MGVYIEGMEMPKERENIYMIVFSDGKACASYKPFEWHEVVPVPPHGDLIDRNVLEENAQKRLLMCNQNDNQFQKPYEVMRAIALAPTVIAEEVYGQYTDTAGNFHWTGTHSGEHVISTEEGE